MNYQNPLDKEYKFNLKIEGWQILLIALSIFFVPYIAWEVYWYSKVGAAAIKWHTWIAILVFFLALMFIPKKPFILIRKIYFLFILYVSLSLAVGEVHPFTKVPMYSSFQDKVTIFSVRDTAENLIPFNNFSKLSSGAVIHKYFNALNNFQKQNYNQKVAEKLAIQYLEKELKLNTQKQNLYYNEIYILGDSIKIKSQKARTDE